MTSNRKKVKDSSRTYTSCFASLRIESTTKDFIDFNEVERQLGLKSTRVVRHGETILLPNKQPAMVDVWIYKAEVEKTSPLADHLAALKQRLDPHADYLRSIASRWRVSVYCDYITNLAEGHIVIPPNLTKMFNDYGVELEISILSWGGVLNDDHDEDDELPKELEGKTARSSDNLDL